MTITIKITINENRCSYEYGIIMEIRNKLYDNNYFSALYFTNMNIITRIKPIIKAIIPALIES